MSLTIIKHRLCLTVALCGQVIGPKKLVPGCCLLLFAFLVQAQEIKIYSGIHLVMNNNIYFVANNTAFVNNGTFTASGSTIALTGDTDTSVSYISGNSFTRFNNLTINKSLLGVAIKSAVGVKNVLTVSAGNLYTDSNLTLLSDAINTARLAAVPTGANIFGKTVVERYIPSRRAWRMLTAPVTEASSIYKTWQNNGVYSPGKGLLVSGPGAANGLDNGNAASLKTFDIASQALMPVTNTYVPISATNNGSADNTGYFIFIRGDRDPGNFIVPNSNVTTLTSIGQLQTGTQSFTAATTSGNYTLIGNPYASPVDFNNVSRTNLLKRFIVWDPTLNTLGGYVSIDDLDNNGVYSKSVALSTQTNEIQSSQAFFVETDVNGPASLTFNESSKSTTNNTGVFRPAGHSLGSAVIQSIRANLYLLNTDKSVVLADGTLAEFNNSFKNTVTNEDAIKFTNINESIALVRNGAVLAMERRPVITTNDTLFFRLWKTTKRNYQIQLVPLQMDQKDIQAFFEDSYLSTSIPVSFFDTTKINFSVDGNIASAAMNRFRIVFKTFSVLPVSFSSVKAYRFNNQVKVDWKVQQQINIVRYDVEKSTNALDFEKVGSTAKNISGSYEWMDVNALEGENFYRIRSIDEDGSAKYSAIVNVRITKFSNQFLVQPNPIKGNSIEIHFKNQPAGSYRFNLFNTSGQVVFSSGLQIISSATSVVLKPTVLAPGIYQLQITGTANSILTQKVIINQ